MLKMKRIQLQQPLIFAHLPQQQFHEFDLVHWTLAWLQNQNLKFNSTSQPANSRAEFSFANVNFWPQNQICSIISRLAPTWGGLAVIPALRVAAGAQTSKQDPHSMTGISAEREVEQGVDHGGGVDSPLHDRDVGLAHRDEGVQG